MFIQPSVRVRALIAAVALSAMPLAARAVEVPATVVTADTMLVAWVDIGAFDQMIDGMPSWMANVPAGQKAEVEKNIKLFAQYQKEFKALGGEGVLVGMGQPAKENDKPEVYVLLKTAAGADRAKLEKLLHSAAGQAKGQQEQTAILAAKIEPYGTSTTWHALTGESLVFPPLSGTAKDAAVFNAALKPVEKASMQLCFRMLPKMKGQVQAQLDEQAKNPNGGGNPMAGMLSGMLEPMVKLEVVTASCDLAKDAQQAGLILHFADAKSASDFSASFNGLVEMGKGFANMQVAQMAKYGVDTANFNEVVARIALKADQNDAGIQLDHAFFTKAQLLASQFKAAQEKMPKGGPVQGSNPPVNVDDDGDDAAQIDAAEKAGNAK